MPHYEHDASYAVYSLRSALEDVSYMWGMKEYRKTVAADVTTLLKIRDDLSALIQSIEQSAE